MSGSHFIGSPHMKQASGTAMERFVQSVAVLVAATTALFCMESQVQASWFLDASRHHVSVHGQLSCSECHGGVFSNSSHPNCADVNRSVRDFFQNTQCTSCHSEVMKALEDGSHAGKPIKPEQKYDNCIVCHDPHYQLASKSLPPAFDPSKPVDQQCGVCHKQRTSLPVLSVQDQKCMACHQAVERGNSDGVRKVSVFCFECHSKEKSGRCASASTAVPIIDGSSYSSTTHSKQSCLVCHPGSSEFGHAKRERTACLSCHQRHDEKVTHDAHLRVSCEACHLAGVTPVKSREFGKILWQIDRKPDRPIGVHSMTLKGVAGSCERCHHSGNALGASAMVLPPKSIICMPCHAATLSVGDTTTIVSLLVFLLGLAGLCAVWVSGSVSETQESAPVIRTDKNLGNTRGISSVTRVLTVLKIMALDVFLQRRLFKQSRIRWLIHALIFFPFMFRFLWGIAALMTSLWIPQSSLPWTLLDKDYPLGATLFDVSGLLILIGVILTALRRVVVPSPDMAGIPKQDWVALSLIGATVVIGFVLEGARIAMEGSPAGSGYAFLGYSISCLWGHVSILPDAYGYIWYLHAIATGAVVAYFPFSHLLHIIMAPVVLAMNAMSVRSENPAKGLVNHT